MNSTDQSEPDQPSRLRRRDFLVLGSVGLMMPVVGDLAWAQPLAEMAGAEVRPMPVGYIAESETFRSLRRLPRKVRRPLAGSGDKVGDASPVIIPAASLYQGDTNLPGRPLRIHIHGLYPETTLKLERPERIPQAVDLEVLFPSPDPYSPRPLRFYAWSFRKRPVWSPSPPVSFRFPLEWDVQPEMVLRIRTAEGLPLVLRTKLTVDAEAGRPRLRRGAYLLGFNPGIWDHGEVKVTDLARRTPAEMVSILVSMDPEPEA